MELRKELWPELLEYQRQNKFAYLSYPSIAAYNHGRDSVREEIAMFVLLRNYIINLLFLILNLLFII